MRRPWIAIALLSGCWYEKPRVAHPTPRSEAVAEPSYRSTTIAVDAIGVATLTAGLIGLQRGGHDDRSGGLMCAGLATAAFATPIIHLAKGEKGRAGWSYLARSFSSIGGLIVGLSLTTERDDLGANILGMTWGIAGGLAVAGAIDAIFLHEPSRTWTPTVMPAEGGARVGIGGVF